MKHLILFSLFAFTLSCSKDSIERQKIPQNEYQPTEIILENLRFTEIFERSGIVFQPIDFPGSYTTYNYLNGSNIQSIFNHSLIDSILYQRWNSNDANFGSFIGSNYVKSSIFKDGTITRDSVVTSTARGDTFVIKSCAYPILKDGLTFKKQVYRRDAFFMKTILNYRYPQSSNLYYWTLLVDDLNVNTRVYYPENSKSLQWQLKNVM